MGTRDDTGQRVDEPKEIVEAFEGVPSENLLERIDSPGDSTTDKASKTLNSLLKGSPVVIRKDHMWEYFDAATKLSQQRTSKYRDYDLMEQDSLLASALELMADDACQYSPERGATIWPARGSDTKFINSVFEKIDIENRIWGWTYNVAKYGDFFLMTKEKEGKFFGFEESIHPQDVKRIDIDGRLAAFAFNEDSKFHLMDPWRFIHFMNNYKPTFEKITLKRTSEADPSMEAKNTTTLTSRYGTSVLEAARKIYKILNLLEQAVALARLNRAPLLRVFYINTEGLTPEERDETVARMERHFKEQMAVDLRSNMYQSEFKPLSFSTDIFIPYSGSVGDVRTEQLGGELNIRDLADLDYLKNKLFASIRVPKAFLGFEESVPDSGGQTTLVRLDIRYARMIKKLQRATIAGVKRMLSVVYAYEKKQNPQDKHTSIKMEIISGVEELDRMSGLERRMSVAQQMVSLMRDLEGTTDPTPVYEYVFSDILGLKELGLKFKKAAQEPEEGSRGGQFASTLPPALAALVETALKEGKVEKLIPLMPALYKLGMKDTVIEHPDAYTALPSDEQLKGYEKLEADDIKEIVEETVEERQGGTSAGDDTIVDDTGCKRSGDTE